MLLRPGVPGAQRHPTAHDRVRTEGSGLERYAARFNAVEINTSFYRSHKPETYARFRRNVEKSRDDLMALLRKMKQDGPGTKRPGAVY